VQSAAPANGSNKAPAKVASKTPTKTPAVKKRAPARAPSAAPAAKALPETAASVVSTSKVEKVEKADKTDKTEKVKKPKLVRDSYTIPKAEYQAMDALKQRATALGQPPKKSELLRAGIMALTGLSDAALLAALAAVPAIKTGRPKD
jgi:hypothetical protein